MQRNLDQWVVFVCNPTSLVHQFNRFITMIVWVSKHSTIHTLNNILQRAGSSEEVECDSRPTIARDTHISIQSM